MTRESEHGSTDPSAAEGSAGTSRDEIGPILVAAARFETAAYRSIAREGRFLAVALLIVTLSAVSHAALGVVWATNGGWAPIRSVVPAALSQFIGWAAVSMVAFAAGRALGSDATLGGVVRAVGVAMFPTIMYILGVFPPLLLVMGAWWIAATFVALRGSLGLAAGPAAVVVAMSVVTGYLLAGLATVSVLAWLE